MALPELVIRVEEADGEVATVDAPEEEEEEEEGVEIKKRAFQCRISNLSRHESFP